MDSDTVEKHVMACFRVPHRQYKAVRLYAVREGVTMQQLMTDMFSAWMDQFNVKVEEKD